MGYLSQFWYLSLMKIKTHLVLYAQLIVNTTHFQTSIPSVWISKFVTPTLFNPYLTVKLHFQDIL